MFSNSNIDVSNCKVTKYLSNYDLINKYNSESIYKNPKLKKIIVELSSEDLLLASEYGNKKALDPDVQIKSFLILYIFYSLKPFININNKSSSKDDGDSKFSLKIVLSSPEEIDSFLKSLFIENWNKLNLEDFSLIKKNIKRYSQHISENKDFILNAKIPAGTFLEIDSLLSKNLLGINSKALNLKVGFLFSNPLFKIRKTSTNLIKNLPLFWING